MLAFGRFYSKDQLVHPMLEVRLNNIIINILLTTRLGVFLLCAKFSDDYPFKPPEIRFVTPVHNYITFMYSFHNFFSTVVIFTDLPL